MCDASMMVVESQWTWKWKGSGKSIDVEMEGQHDDSGK